jgi:hypothetical protein
LVGPDLADSAGSTISISRSSELALAWTKPGDGWHLDKGIEVVDKGDDKEQNVEGSQDSTELGKLSVERL